MQDIISKKEETGEITEQEERKLKDLKRQAEEQILKEADVICTTCVAAFDQRLKYIRFKQVLIDEAT